MLLPEPVVSKEAGHWARILALGAADTSGALRSCTAARNHDNVEPLSVGRSPANTGAPLMRVEELQIHLARSLRIR